MNNSYLSSDESIRKYQRCRVEENILGSTFRKLCIGLSMLSLLAAGTSEAAVRRWKTSYNLMGCDGYVSWYGPGFHGNTTASGEIFNQYDITAASRSLPFGSMIKVVNKINGREVIVRINDRGPYVGNRILDLSAGAADAIGMKRDGVVPVCVYRQVQESYIAEDVPLRGDADIHIEGIH